MNLVLRYSAPHRILVALFWCVPKGPTLSHNPEITPMSDNSVGLKTGVKLPGESETGENLCVPGGRLRHPLLMSLQTGPKKPIGLFLGNSRRRFNQPPLEAIGDVTDGRPRKGSYLLASSCSFLLRFIWSP